MTRPSNVSLFLSRVVRRAAARRSAVISEAARAPFRRGAAVAVAALALAGPSVEAQAPVPQGGEIRVNTLTANQALTPAVARDADGDFVVVWSGPGAGDNLGGVFAQRYAASGAPVGGAFLVNTRTEGTQRIPSVAMDDDGDFVVAWESQGADGSNSQYGISARRYAASGAPVGAEFLVNTTTEPTQRFASVAVDADGDFVVAWTSGPVPTQTGQDGSQYGVYARRYAASGTAVGSEFRVNTYTTGDQLRASVAMDADGDFVVAWESFGQDGSDFGIYAQRYAASGGAVGPEVRVNTFTTSAQRLPSVDVDADGDFVVAWGSPGQDGDGFGVVAQRYTSSGTPVGGEFRVNTYTTNNQRDPSVAVDADGDFVVAWESGATSGGGQDGSGYGVYARAYAASGAPVSGEFRVNTTTNGSQARPSMAIDADGDFVVVWETGNFQSPDEGVYAQRYAAAGTVSSEPGIPASFSLAVAPSPIGPTGGTVRFDLAEPARVRLALYDVLGREVAVLADGDRGAGAHEARLDAGQLAPGVYVVRLEAGSTSATRSLTVVR